MLRSPSQRVYGTPMIGPIKLKKRLIEDSIQGLVKAPADFDLGDELSEFVPKSIS